MVSIPDTATHRREFAGLAMAERRAVLRAVNRGQQVERAKLAGHAVVVARRQRKLWARMPFAGPLVALTQFGLGWEAVLVSALISTAAMAAISRFWWQRATRAEALNTALTSEGKRRAKHAKNEGAKHAKNEGAKHAKKDGAKQANQAGGKPAKKTGAKQAGAKQAGAKQAEEAGPEPRRGLARLRRPGASGGTGSGGGAAEGRSADAPAPRAASAAKRTRSHTPTRADHRD